MVREPGEQSASLDPATDLGDRCREGVLEALVVQPPDLVLAERGPGTLVRREEAQGGARVEAGLDGKGAEGALERDGEHPPEVDEQRRGSGLPALGRR